MSRKIVIGDIHGGYQALIDLIALVKINKSDQLIFLGDYVDGWSESPEVIDYLISLNKEFDCIFIRGNHDQLLLDWLLTKTNNELWLQHGGDSSVRAYENIVGTRLKQHIDFLSSLKMNHLDAKNRLFVHAGFTNPNGIEKEYFSKMFFWDRTLWEMALSLDPLLSKDSVLYPKRLRLYQEIYIGHTPVTRINETTPICKSNVWNVDTGAAFKGSITAMDITTKEYWQSKPVFTYYPNEKGRN